MTFGYEFVSCSVFHKLTRDMSSFHPLNTSVLTTVKAVKLCACTRLKCKAYNCAIIGVVIYITRRHRATAVCPYGIGDRLRAGKPPQYFTKTQANSASYPQTDGKWVLAKVRRRSVVGVKGRYGSFHLWINAWVAGKTVRSIVNTCHIPERKPRLHDTTGCQSGWTTGFILQPVVSCKRDRDE